MLPNDVAAAYPLFTVAHRDHIEAKPMPAVVSQSMEAATRPAGDLAKQIDGRPTQQASKALESEAWDVGGHGDPAVELPFSLYSIRWWGRVACLMMRRPYINVIGDIYVRDGHVQPVK